MLYSQLCTERVKEGRKEGRGEEKARVYKKFWKRGDIPEPFTGPVLAVEPQGM